jgi:hypothetical protein
MVYGDRTPYTESLHRKVPSPLRERVRERVMMPRHINRARSRIQDAGWRILVDGVQIEQIKEGT